MMRKATPGDLEAMTAIYNECIAEGGFTGDLEPQTVESRRSWFSDHQGRYAIFVKEMDGSAAGYAALSPYRKGRRAFEGTCEISYYLSARFRGAGFGAEMIGHALEKAEQSGFRLAIAIVLAANRTSIGILDRFGFSVSGRLPQAAEIAGEFIDHVYLHRLLTRTSPPEKA